MDITMCVNSLCRIRARCLRYSGKPGEIQAYNFFGPDKQGVCSYLIPEKEISIDERERIDEKHNERFTCAKEAEDYIDGFMGNDQEEG